MTMTLNEAARSCRKAKGAYWTENVASFGLLISNVIHLNISCH